LTKLKKLIPETSSMRLVVADGVIGSRGDVRARCQTLRTVRRSDSGAHWVNERPNVLERVATENTRKDNPTTPRQQPVSSRTKRGRSR
jgi:hypothetical protein